MKSPKSHLSRDMAIMAGAFGLAGAAAIPISALLATAFAGAAALTGLVSVLLNGRP